MRSLDDEDYGDWLFHKRQDDQRDKELDFLGVTAKEAKQVVKTKPKQQQPTGWVPSYQGEEPPF